jgi:phosphotransferase system enzyme I (PtsI)
MKGDDADNDMSGFTSGVFVAEQGVIRKGIPAASGIAFGRAFLVDRRRLKVPKRHLAAESEIDAEVERFRRALDASDRQLERIKHKIEARDDDHYNIITAHQLILHDEHLVDETIRNIRDRGINAEWALRKTVEHIKGIFEAVEDDYFRERRSDIEFVGERVMRNLLGYETNVAPPPDAVVVANDLSPADSAQVYRAAVAGVLTDAGGRTSHTAIIARAHEVPCVVGLENITSLVTNGDLLIVDGTRGEVVIKPTPEMVAEYRERARKAALAGAALEAIRDLPAETTDGVAITLRANIDHINEIPSALGHGARGVGLFRTEYMFVGSEEMPGEEAHFEHATAVMRQLKGEPVTFRTIDFGADKVSRLVSPSHAEANPAMGLRSIRLCLTSAVVDFFTAQVRGLLRASAQGPLKIMFPMISGVHELRLVMQLVQRCKADLKQKKIPFDDNVPIGIMIETPSAAMVADHLAEMVDFFSIGTNDLIQYTLAVDRVNELVSYLYEPMHPAILRLIQRVVQAAKIRGIPVSVCGEMAGDPEVGPLLVGMGFTELSMQSSAVPETKAAIRSYSRADLEKLITEVLELPSGPEVRMRVRDFLGRPKTES